jgi:4-hydroxy-tetrahydrodipicolinate synthase
MLSKDVYTVVLTPFNGEREAGINWDIFKAMIEFQVKAEVGGVLFVETIAGESATLTPQEHCLILEKGLKTVNKRIFSIAGTGSNSTLEAIDYTDFAFRLGYKAVVLIAPYCNPVSSWDIRENYYREIAKKYPQMIVIPYSIPERTGIIEPADLAFLDWKNPNVCASIEVNTERVRDIKEVIRVDFGIFSGDDAVMWEMLSDLNVDGIFSVISNIAPFAVKSLINFLEKGSYKEAEKIRHALSPLLISKIQQERSVVVSRNQKNIHDNIYNPVIIKTMMNGLGLPVGVARKPLGKMNKGSVEKIRNSLKTVWNNNPWVLEPFKNFYNLDIESNLNNDNLWNRLST